VQHEKGIPDGADMKPPLGHDALLEAFVYWSSINPNRFYREGWG